MFNWPELLNSIENIESKYEETLRRAASDEEITALKNEAIRKLGASTLPQSYIIRYYIRQSNPFYKKEIFSFPKKDLPLPKCNSPNRGERCKTKYKFSATLS